MSNDFLILMLKQIQNDIRDHRAEIKSDLESIDEKVELLMAWRWKIYGTSAAISTIGGFLISWILR